MAYDHNPLGGPGHHRNRTSRHKQATPPLRSRTWMAPGALGMLLLAGLAACGNDTDSTPADTAAVVTESADTEPDSSEPAPTEPVVTESVTTEPVVTESGAADGTIPATEPVGESDPATSPATSIELTPELETFASENSALLNDWAAQLATFGTEAINNLEAVSAAPSAPRLLELSDEVVATIGPDTTDAGLVTARDFATGVSTAINQSIDGDQEGALTTFFALQEQVDQLTTALEQFSR